MITPEISEKLRTNLVIAYRAIEEANEEFPDDHKKAKLVEIAEQMEWVRLQAYEYTKQQAALAPHAVEQAVPEPDWSLSPRWAMWWTVDENGQTRWHEREPSWDVGARGWYDNGKDSWVYKTKINADRVEIPVGVDWRLLKVQRHTPAPTLAE